MYSMREIFRVSEKSRRGFFGLPIDLQEAEQSWAKICGYKSWTGPPEMDQEGL